MLALSVVVPAILIFNCYKLVYRTTHRRSCRVAPELNAHPVNFAKRYRLTKTFFVVSIVSVICLLPASTLLVIDQLFSLHVTLIGARIAHFSTEQSPQRVRFLLIYVWVIRPFRREMANLFNLQNKEQVQYGERINQLKRISQVLGNSSPRTRAELITGLRQSKITFFILLRQRRTVTKWQLNKVSLRSSLFKRFPLMMIAENLLWLDKRIDWINRPIYLLCTTAFISYFLILVNFTLSYNND